MKPSKYGICSQCHSPINIPVLAAFKCYKCGCIKTNYLKYLHLKISDLTEKNILRECQYLLSKIANHPYSIKLLINAYAALEIIPNYKAKKLIFSNCYYLKFK